MNAQVNAGEIQKLLPSSRKILCFELAGLIAFFLGLILWGSRIPSIGLLLGGMAGITRGSDLRRWRKRSGTLLGNQLSL